MPLDPDVQALVQQFQQAAEGAPPIHELTPDQVRAAFADFVQFQGPPEVVARVEDLDVEGPGGPIPVRIYRPTPAPLHPVVQFMHGGGWVIGDLDSHDPLCRALANATGAAVVAVHYRRAPEAPFPAAVEDAYAVLQWLDREEDAHGLPPRAPSARR